MKWLRSSIFILGSLATAQFAQAYELAGPGGDKFDVNIPMTFEHVFSSEAPVEMHEFVPSGEQMTSWSEMITISRMPGTYLDANGALKDYGSIKLLAYIETCASALMQPVIENSTINGLVSLSTSFGCVTKEVVRSLPQIDVRPFEFLSVTYVQGKEHVYEVQRAVHFDELTEASLPQALAQNEVNLEYTREALKSCCGE
jgi:hypothetical protein